MINLKECIAKLPQTDDRTEFHILKTRQKFKRHFIIWTDEEVEILSFLYQQKLSLREISKHLERTENAIKLRMESNKLENFPEAIPLATKTKPKGTASDFKNRDPALNLLHYWRTSLADESKLGLSAQAMKHGKEFSLNQFAAGCLPAEEIQHFFIHAEKELRKKKRFSQEDKEDISIQKLSVIIAPYTAIKEYEHGKEKGANFIKECFPLWLTATLTRNGTLLPDEENSSYPWLERRCLSPNENHGKNLGFPIIGDINDIDNYYALNANILTSEKNNWNDFFDFGNNLLQSLRTISPHIFEEQHFSLIEKGYILPLSNTQDVIKPILNIYDRYLFTKNKKIPCLLKNFLSLNKEEETKVGDIDFTELLFSNQKHLGQMEKKHPLSKSQRLSMNYLSYQKDGEIFTIHGPPGTGKTSLLLSVIASQWVDAALNKKMPPLIVATSTNNLAVTNILDGFNKTKNEGTILENRWLPEVNSFGAYLCSSSKENDASKKEYFYLLKDGSGSLAKFYKENYIKLATSFFLKQFNTHYNQEVKNIKNCKDFIYEQMSAKKNILTDVIVLIARYKPMQEKLLQYADNIQTLSTLIKLCEEEINNLETSQLTIKKLRADWFIYKSIAFKWLQFFQWLPFVKKILGEKLRLFTAKEHLFFDEIIDDSEKIEALIETKLNGLGTEEKKKELSELNAVKEAYKQFIEDKLSLEKKTGLQISLDMLYDYTNAEHFNCLLDTTLRYDLFILASHYWETCWLLESPVLTSLDKSFDGRQKYWQIQSMLTPCFVTTFYTGSSFFNYLTSSKEFESLHNFIDLLIIDEAGQALPALSGAMISIAKKALLVGDALQIEPVFKIPENIDMANAKKFNLCKDELGYEELKSLGILCSGNPYTGHSYGNLITVGQRKAKYHLQGQKLPGMLLLEHRRCSKDIISYCNELCYDNQLVPLALEKESIFPRLGYAHVKGIEEKLGGSRCNKIEARVIASWVAKNKDKILENCQQDNLTDCLAIVTPFAAQKNEIQAELQRHDIYLDKVGTIHSLQGAEKEIVIFSSVYTAENQGGLFFDKSPNMLNVAVSRAKRSFLVFGDMEIFDPSLNHPSSLLANYLFANENNEITDISIPILPQIIAEEVETITTLIQHRHELIQSFSNAQHILTIVSPYLFKKAIEYDAIEQHIMAHSSRIVINIYTDPYLNKKNEDFAGLLTILTAAGANLILVDRVHSKIIAIDDKTIIIGSFNWLSASRNNYNYIREETSLIYRGSQVSRIIETTLEPIKDKVKTPVEKMKEISWL